MPAESPVQEILDELKQAKWLNLLCPKSCEGRWCSFEDSLQWWQPFLPERLGGTKYLGIQQGWHLKQKDAFMTMMRHLSPATHKETCDAEDKETMMTSAKKEALEREKCTDGLHYSAVIMANGDVQFEARAAAWAHFLRIAEQGCALVQACATGALMKDEQAAL